jgi:hypothetical protein
MVKKMKVFEIKSIFRIIQDANIWTVICEHGALDHDWRITISNEKGASFNFTQFGPLNNETVIGLLKDNLMFL